MDKLKPCPFCGGKAKVVSHPVAQKQSQYSVHCQCGARFLFRDRKYKAVNAWNTRTGDEKQIPKKPDTKITNRGIDITGEYDIDSDYLCPTCKCVVGDCETEDYWYNYCPGCGQKIDWSDAE